MARWHTEKHICRISELGKLAECSIPRVILRVTGKRQSCGDGNRMNVHSVLCMIVLILMGAVQS